MFDRVSVWLDEHAPDAGAFAHALEWASRLQLPLHGVLLPGNRHRSVINPSAVEAGVLERCAQRCGRARVAWQGTLWNDAPALCVQDFLVPRDLCVYGQSLPTPRKDELLYWSLRSQTTASLVCADSWAPMTRVLVLNQSTRPGSTFLRAAARLCHQLRAVPVVLTVARSEKEGRLRLRQAEAVFAAEQSTADFDLVIGCEVRAAVTLEAHCRRCTHVFVERQAARSWWRWLRGEPLQRLLGLSADLTFFNYSDPASCSTTVPQRADPSQHSEPVAAGVRR